MVIRNEIDSGQVYTIKCAYSIHYSTSPALAVHLPWAVTSHYDPQHPTDDIQTAVFADGLGRTVQTKRDAEVGGVAMRVLSGLAVYDEFGRVKMAFHPAVESLTDSITVFNPVVNTFVPPTMTEYDILDRTVRVQLPTGDVTTTAYGFGTHDGKTYFQTATTDPLGTTVRTLTNTIGLTVKQSAPLGAVTTFTYDPIGQLLSSTDPGGLTTTHTYDMLGRRTQRAHPDAGTDRWTYDPAGNMLTHQTQLLYNANKSVNYHYTYSRLDSITYPSNPRNNVRYTYGDSTAADNTKGRVHFLRTPPAGRASSTGRWVK